MPQDVTITFLGGLGDIGRNCAAIETGDSLLILDCGQLFAGEDRPGVDSILPDIDYLRDRADRIIGCITTHGHEDHLGALAPVIAMGLTFPIYASGFTLGLIRHRLEERDLLSGIDLIQVSDNERVSIGPFDVEFLPVTHSVPGGLISSIGTPQGVVLHSSDFKLDLHPIDDRRTDLSRIGAIAQDPGVRLLLADSTNSEVPGHSRSESAIGPELLNVFRSHGDRRLICAAFSSHIHRIQQIADAALDGGRMIATLGLSMKRNVSLARQLGLLRIPDASLVDISEIDAYPPEKVCVISTGSQGEQRAALAQAAYGRSRWLDIGPDDTIVLSSHPIPGNEAKVSGVINELVLRGAKVVTSAEFDIHTSGHGKRDELTTLHSLAEPEWFVPVHGEHRHLWAHAELARSLGMPHDNVLEAVDGDQIIMSDDGLSLRQGATSGAHMLVHGPFIGPDRGVVGERQVLSDGGFVSVSVLVDIEARDLLAHPRVESRGWLDNVDVRPLHADIAMAVEAAIGHALHDGVTDVVELERRVRRTTGQYVSDNTDRRPMVVPIVIEAH